MEMQGEQLAIFQRTVFMFQHGVELDRLAGFERVAILANRQFHFAGHDPADFDVVVMHFGPAGLGSCRAFAMKELEVHEVDVLEFETAGDVMLRGGNLREPAFRKAQQIQQDAAKRALITTLGGIKA